LQGTVTWAISHRADRASPAAHPSAARRAGAPLRCAGARRTRTPRERSRDPGYRLDDPSRGSRSTDPRHPRDGPLALTLAWPRRGANGQAPGPKAGSAQRTVPRSPSTGAVVLQLARRRLTVSRAYGPSHRSNPPLASFRRRRRASTGAPPSPATTAAGRWRFPPRSPDRRDPTRSPQVFSPVPSRASCFKVSTSSSVRSCGSESHRSIGRMAAEPDESPGQIEGQGPFPSPWSHSPSSSAPSRSMWPRSRLGSRRSRRRRLSVLASGKPPSALRSQIVSPS
jgi:hypothetical protein